MLRAKILRLVLAAWVCLPAWGATFGKVVQIGGHASDIALDERRGLLYAANFTANRIEVISTSDFSLRTPMPVPPQPGSIALSPDGRYLAISRNRDNKFDPAGWQTWVVAVDGSAQVDLTQYTGGMGYTPWRPG